MTNIPNIPFCLRRGMPLKDHKVAVYHTEKQTTNHVYNIINTTHFFVNNVDESLKINTYKTDLRILSFPRLIKNSDQTISTNITGKIVFIAGSTRGLL